MEIKKAVEIFRTESQKLLCDSTERDFQAYSKAVYVISKALKDGYTLCKVDEAVEKMKERGHSLPVHIVEGILKEACK